MNEKEFVKIDGRENFICSFDMLITKDHLKLTRLVAKGPQVSALRYIFLDPYNLALVASDGYTLKEYPVIIEAPEPLPDGLNLFIDPKHFKEMKGTCSVCVYSREGGNITEITNDKGQTFVCDYAGKFPRYRQSYPDLSKDGFIKIQKNELKEVAGFIKEIAKRNKRGGFSLRIIAGENKAIFSSNEACGGALSELSVTLEKAALIDARIGFYASRIIPLLSGWNGGAWLVSPDRPAVFDDKAARIGLVMPMDIENPISPNLKYNVKPLERSALPADQPKEQPAKKQEKHSLPELSAGPVSEKTNANAPTSIAEGKPVHTYTPELSYIDRPLVFPVPNFMYKHDRTISQAVAPELLSLPSMALLFVSMKPAELLRRYIERPTRARKNANELFWGDSMLFYTGGNHRIRDGTKEANKPEL
ncbi:hypothetical protein ABLT32_13695 [Bacteroides pyogenes]|uniref:hypothetical protein n=1 Tax=Bacteroides pyogenes TaxID=310300 RepID=UPI004063DCF9